MKQSSFTLFSIVLFLTLILFPSLSYCLISGSLILFNVKLPFENIVFLVSNIWWINLVPKVLGTIGLCVLLIKNRHSVNLQVLKNRLFRLSVIGFTACLCVSVIVAEAPLANAMTVATTGYVLDTPLPIADWYIGKYSDGSYFAINGSNWDNLVAGVGSTAWSAYKNNATKLTELVLGEVTSGTVYMKEVAFDLALMNSIPANVKVVCSYGDESYTYVNSADNLGSPYTISIGTGINNGYYIAADSGNRIVFSSTNAYTTINNTINSSATYKIINVKQGSYPLTTLLDIPSYVTILGEGKGRGYLTVSGSDYTVHTAGKGTIFYGEASAALDSIILLDDAHNVEIKDISIEGTADKGINVINGGSDIDIDVSIISTGNSSSSNIVTGISTNGASGGYNTYSGLIWGTDCGVYANADWSTFKNLEVLCPREKGFWKTGIGHVSFEDCGVNDWRNVTSAVAYQIDQARHLTMTRCVSELYNPAAYHVNYTTFDPTDSSDCVGLYDCLFYGNAQITPQRLNMYYHGVLTMPSTANLLVTLPALNAYNVSVTNGIVIGGVPGSFKGGFSVSATGAVSMNNGFAYNKAVPANATSVVQNLFFPQSNANYAVFVSPNWDTTWWITDRTTTQFTVHFGTPSTNVQYISYLVIHDANAP